MFSATTRYDVLRALAAGLDARRIEGLTGVPPRSQRRIAEEEIPFQMTDTQLQVRCGVGRPSGLSADVRQVIESLLVTDPVMHVSEVLRRLRSHHGFHGGKSAVYELVKRTRPVKSGPLPVIRFEGVAGEFAQHDFGELVVRFRDGTTERLHFYAGRLKYSRAMHVSLAPKESTEGYIRGMEQAAVRWGGLPLLNVVDNHKAAVLQRVKVPDTGEERIQYQPQFATFLQELSLIHI